MKRFILYFPLLVLYLVFTGCDSANNSTNSAYKTVKLNFALSADIWPETFLSFYIHAITLIDNDGVQYPFLPDSPNKAHPDLALIELNAETKRALILRGKMPGNARFVGITFKLGVPQMINHANPLTAKPPLDTSSMFWSWQQGYKFLRIDSENPEKPWALHLGSTNCQSPSPLRPPKEACERPNVPEVTLKKNFDTELHIAVTLTQFQRHIVEAATSCTGNYTLNRSCEALLKELGIDAQTGRCIDHCRSQSLFSVAE